MYLAAGTERCFVLRQPWSPQLCVTCAYFCHHWRRHGELAGPHRAELPIHVGQATHVFWRASGMLVMFFTLVLLMFYSMYLIFLYWFSQSHCHTLIFYQLLLINLSCKLIFSAQSIIYILQLAYRAIRTQERPFFTIKRRLNNEISQESQ